MTEKIGYPSLIVTLHRKNASRAALPRLLDWLSDLDALGLSQGTVHILERDGPVKHLTLSPQENIDAFLSLFEAQLRMMLGVLTGDIHSLQDEALNSGGDGDEGYFQEFSLELLQRGHALATASGP